MTGTSQLILPAESVFVMIVVIVVCNVIVVSGMIVMTVVRSVG